MTCQDDCEIRTVPDPFFSLPNDKWIKAVWPRETINRAALECGVLPTTFKDKVAGKVAPSSKMDQKPYLTEDEENELEKFVTDCAKIGYGKMRQDMMKIFEKHMANKGHEMCKGMLNGWWNRFIK